MSTVENSQSWQSVPNDMLKSKYEKCRNITEEIYKRINLTFEIKKLGTNTISDLSDHSDQIDSNELSNETDLFACDKSDSISSSTEAGKPTTTCEKYINVNNNNEETKLKKMAGTVSKKPKKRFRKRVKKRQSKAKSDSEGSSDEALPLSRMVDVDTKCKSEDDNSKSESPDNVMGVPKIVIITKDLKLKVQESDTKAVEPFVHVKETKIDFSKTKSKEETLNVKDEANEVISDTKKCQENLVKDKNVQKEILPWSCSLCSMSFRGGRGLRRHMTMSHIIITEESKTTRQELRGTRPA